MICFKILITCIKRNDMKIGVVIQARMGSARLPGKVLKELEKGYTVLDFVISQIKCCESIDEIIVATTNLDEDDQMKKVIKKNKVKFFQGNPYDVLDRYYQCAKRFHLTSIVRITSDNPLIEPTLVDQVVEKFKDGQYDYVNNFTPRTFPYGTEAEVFSFETLEKTWKMAKKPTEREHVTPFMYNSKKFNVYSIKNSENLSNLRWTVDRENDLKFIKKIISKIENRPILLENILKLIKENRLLS